MPRKLTTVFQTRALQEGTACDSDLLFHFLKAQGRLQLQSLEMVTGCRVNVEQLCHAISNTCGLVPFSKTRDW